MKIYKKAILPQGFKAGALACGLKRSGRLDLALFYSLKPARAAGLFTSNALPAAPVILDKRLLKNGRGFSAIVANSGNANAFCGKAGLEDARAMAKAAAAALGIRETEVLVASTGIIGRRLPVAKINKAMPKLVAALSPGGLGLAKKAILTTDTFSKEISVELSIGNQRVLISGIAKGAGMVAPNMATMLCFIFSDVAIAQGVFSRALREAVENSFNCISVDGCMSTNDSVIALANAASNCPMVKGGKNLAIFSKALGVVCLELARLIVRDGEGATKFISIKVDGSKSFNQARRAALAIANSALFKATMYGSNPNFGRVAQAVGASGVQVKEEDVKIRMSSLEKRQIHIHVSLGKGKKQATVYTSDLTPRYVLINAEYS